MASFQAKIGWKRQRKRENKNCRSVPTRRVIENSKKIAKKIQKIKNGFIYGVFLIHNTQKKGKKERK